MPVDRQQIADLLAEHMIRSETLPNGDVRMSFPGVDVVADALLPLFDQVTATAAADAVEQAACYQDAEALRLKFGAGSHRGGHQCAADHLRDLAASLRPSPSPVVTAREEQP